MQPPGIVRGVQHCPCTATAQHHSSPHGPWTWVHPGHTPSCLRGAARVWLLPWPEMPTQCCTDRGAHATPPDMLSHVPGHRQGANVGAHPDVHRNTARALTGLHMCPPRCAQAAAHTGAAAPARSAHAARTYTNRVSSSLQTYRQTDAHPVSSPGSHPSLQRQRAMGRAPVCACPLCASVSPRAELCWRGQGCLGDPQTLVVTACPWSGVPKSGGT